MSDEMTGAVADEAVADDTVADGMVEDVSEKAAASTDDERLAYRGVFQRMLIRPEIGAAIGAIAIWVFFWAVSVPFGTASGAASILDVAASPLGIMAVAVAMLMIGGEFDLSTGAATGAFGILLVLMVRDVTSDAGGWGLSLWWAIPLSLVAALILGWFNGTVVDRTGLPSFIVTLGAFFVIRGAKLGYSKTLVDQIQVGRLDQLELDAEANGVSDKGYGQLQEIFAYDWLRNEHIWDWRDAVYMIGVFSGAILLALALYEFQFKRKPGIGTAGILPALGSLVVLLVGLLILNYSLITNRSSNFLVVIILAAVGLVIAGVGGLSLRRYAGRFGGTGIADTVKSVVRSAWAAPGLVIALVGVYMLHSTDSVGGNTTGALLIGAGALVGIIGWGAGRYERRSAGAIDLDGAMGDITSTRAVFLPLAVTIVASILAAVVALGMDSNNDTDLIVEWDLNGWWLTAIALIAAVAAGLFVAARGDNLSTTFSGAVQAMFLASARQRFVTTSLLTFLLAIFFLDQATIQGARATFFILFVALAGTGAFGALRAARERGGVLGSTLLLLYSVAVAGLAFLVRAESTGEKFRTQAFSVLLAIAALTAIWAVASMLFAERRSGDAEADSLAKGLVLAGAMALAIGVTVRLLAITPDEVATATPTKFSVRILWFLAFTAAATWVLGNTKFGSWTFAVGGNPIASRQVGVPASRTKTQLFMLTAVAAWLVGVLLAFRLNTIQASTGDGEEFEYIIAAVVGGNALTGGRGSTLGAAIGAIIMAMSVQGIPSARWNSDWRFVFVGAILLLAVIANNFIRTKAEASR